MGQGSVRLYASWTSVVLDTGRETVRQAIVLEGGEIVVEAMLLGIDFNDEGGSRHRLLHILIHERGKYNTVKPWSLPHAVFGLLVRPR